MSFLRDSFKCYSPQGAQVRKAAGGQSEGGGIMHVTIANCYVNNSPQRLHDPQRSLYALTTILYKRQIRGIFKCTSPSKRLLLTRKRVVSRACSFFFHPKISLPTRRGQWTSPVGIHQSKKKVFMT